MSLDGLSYRRRLFVEAYLGEANGNATEAARRAGYLNPEVLGPRLVRQSSIRAAISARLDSAALPANRVLAILSDHATFSPEDFAEIDENGIRLDFSKAKKRGRLHCIKKLKAVRIRVEGYNPDADAPVEYRTDYEIEFYDAQAALEKLGKYHGLWKDRVEQSGQQSIRVIYDDISASNHQLAPPAPGANGDPALDEAVQRPELRPPVRQDETGDLPPGPAGP